MHHLLSTVLSKQSWWRSYPRLIMGSCCPVQTIEYQAYLWECEEILSRRSPRYILDFHPWNEHRVGKVKQMMGSDFFAQTKNRAHFSNERLIKDYEGNPAVSSRIREETRTIGESHQRKAFLPNWNCFSLRWIVSNDRVCAKKTLS